MRITGQDSDTYGKGSAQAMKELDNVHRVAWFLAYADSGDWQLTSLLDGNGDFTPVGRALFYDLDADKAACSVEA